MPGEVPPPSALARGDGAPTSEIDAENFVLNLVLTQVFQQMLKKPDSDDDADQSLTTANELNKQIATTMAQGITGFGL